MTTETAPDPYPEHTRQAQFLPQAQAIGEFLDTSGFVLAEHRQIEGYREEVLMPVTKSIEDVLADYFGIDRSKIETEKRTMIAAMEAAR